MDQEYNWSPISEDMASTYEWKVGDIVWAKMKGFSTWPGKIALPRPNMKKPKATKPMHCVWFFGSQNFGWIDENQIEDYAEKRKANSNVCKSQLFKNAIVDCDEYISRREAGEDVESQFQQQYEEEELVPVEDEFEYVDDSAQDENVSETSGGRKRRGRSFSREEGEGKKRRSSSISSSWSTSGAPRKKSVAENGEATPKAVKAKTPKKSLPFASGSAHAAASPRKSAATILLNRPTVAAKPDTVPLNIGDISETLRSKQIKPTDLRFGFLGLGNMGSGMVKNLIQSGHKVTVWNRTPEKCRNFVTAGATEGLTPSDVVASSDIIFSCVSDATTAKELIFGNCGVDSEMSAHKAYVEMTGIDVESSKDIADGIQAKGGRYLEAQMQGSKSDSEEGTLIILAAGERSLYDDCLTAFAAISSRSFFLGEVGSAIKMNLVLQLVQGVSVAALTEGLALADRANLKSDDVMEILGLTTFSNDLIKQKGEIIVGGNFGVQHPLQYMQKDLNTALNLGHQIEQPLPLTAAANEVFKHAKRLGYAEHDVSAVYIRARF